MLSQSDLDAKFAQFLAGDQDTANDPYPVFNKMREQAEVYWYKNKVPVITTLAGCREVSLRANDFHSHRGLDRFNLDALNPDEVRMAEEIVRFENLQLSALNGEKHKKTRTVLQRGFGANQVSEMGVYIEEIINDIADEMAAGDGRADLMNLAYRVPQLVIMRLLGVPTDNEEDMEKLKHWSDAIAGVKQFVGVTLPPEAVIAAYGAIKNMGTYIDQLAVSLKQSPDKTHLMGMLLDAEEGERLTADELTATFVMICYAGHETTTNLIGNGLFELLRHRSEWAKLCADPSLATQAPEETMRFNPPSVMIPRKTKCEQQLRGVTIPADTNVLMLYGAANRDPAAFENPEEFIIDRPSNKHIDMGYGMHVCLGAGFARLEARKAYAILSQRFPDMELAAAPESLQWIPHVGFHGLKSLPVTLGRDHGRG